jgi:uncharacterized protein
MLTQKLVLALVEDTGFTAAQVQRVVALLESGNTIPFLARYRKEETGGLDERGLRAIESAWGRLSQLEARREEIREALMGQGVLTPDLTRLLDAARTQSALEDVYLPYRPKRRTRAGIARERGLETLAELFTQATRERPLDAARRFVGKVPEIDTPEAALAGAMDILAERIAENPTVRGRARTLSLKEATLRVSRNPKVEDPQGKYAQYADFTEAVQRAAPHRVLAIDRGEAEKILKVSVQLPDAHILRFMQDALKVPNPDWCAHADAALQDGLKRLLGPALERDIRQTLTEKAQAHAITVFAANVKALLLQPPLKGRVVLGIDPGFRTGCKVVVVDPTGRPLGEGTVIYPHEPQKQWQAAIATLRHLMTTHRVDVVAIGNGTASRETEQLVAESVAGTAVRYAIVSEAGASVYSASEVAHEEFPDLDATQRGNISIARRLQDPLAELVKIDPASIGVGMYQHDLDQTLMQRTLAGVVEDAVNHVGVDLNTASVSLLTHVSGLNQKVARAVVSERVAQGPFRSRAALKGVKGLGAKTFEQCAGFLRILDGDEPLDATAIHPEAYPAVQKLLRHLELDLGGADVAGVIRARRAGLDVPGLAQVCGVGVPTLEAMLEALARPGRDPREDLPAPHLRSDVLKLSDLKVGLRLTGTVRNVVDFGVFVDIGLKQDGLIHVSELATQFVKDPYALVSVGDVLEVLVIDVDAQRGRIALSRKQAIAPQPTR